MKSILLPLTPNMREQSPIKAAATIAEQFGATINGLFVRADPRAAISFMGEGLTADMMQDLCEATEKDGLNQADRCENTFNELLSNLTGDAKARWQIVIGEITCHVGRKARTADLAICPQPSADQPAAQEILYDLIYRSGRPVLMVPESYSNGSIGQNILIAWNGSAEGARAVGASLPFLQGADAVTVLQVGEIKTDRPGLDDVASYLSDYDVATTLVHQPASDASVGSDILAYADKIDADMIVAGAYSHSRWREMILGGVTTYFVQNSLKIIFMSH